MKTQQKLCRRKSIKKNQQRSVYGTFNRDNAHTYLLICYKIKFTAENIHGIITTTKNILGAGKKLFLEMRTIPAPNFRS